MFPVMFYVLFGLLLNRGHQAAGVNAAAYLMAKRWLREQRQQEERPQQERNATGDEEGG